MDATALYKSKLTTLDSALGGQVDFVRGAFASKGGESIIVVPSTAAKGKVSRLVPRLDGLVTTPP
jgi:itaconate CoA-transferase